MKLKHTEPEYIEFKNGYQHYSTLKDVDTDEEVCEVFAPTKEILLERIQTIISAFEIAGRSVK